MPRHRWFVLLFVCTIAVSAVAQAPLRKRLDYNDPNYDRALYKRAIELLKARDKDDVADSDDDPKKNGWKWFVSRHNGDGSLAYCRHHNELFLPWHRQLLRLFELALRDATGRDDLVLPYWNWTAEPPGAIPADFKDPSSVLYERLRFPGMGDGHTSTNAAVRRTIDANTSFRSFMGGACTGPFGPCTIKDGAFEDKHHNGMHDWTGGRNAHGTEGLMADDQKAAGDPLFWPFHVYVDLVYDCWQKKTNNFTPSPTCGTCQLPYLPGTPADVVRTAALGYTYDFAGTPCGDLGLPFAKFDIAERSASAGPVVVPFTIPEYEFSTADVVLRGLEIFADYNYAVAVYLYPASTALAPKSEAFRERYLVDRFTVFGTATEGHEAHAQELEINVNATTELAYLAKKHAGAKWAIAVVFDPPHEQHDDAAGTPAEMARRLTLDGVTVVYDAGWQNGGGVQ